jgi:hypothetical protein
VSKPRPPRPAASAAPAEEAPRVSPYLPDLARRRPANAPVTTALLTLALLAGASAARAQAPIQDNSFLIEEAYNQERGVVQHISTFSRAQGTGDWAYTFTQEWPVPDERHQLSFTLPVQELHAAAAARTGLGDLALNYRYQAVGNGQTGLAVSPRLSLLMPTGRVADNLGSGGVAVQLALPVSRTVGSHLVTHWNVLVTHTFSARDADGHRAAANAFGAGQSLVWLARPRFNVLVETLWTRSASVTGEGRTVSSDGFVVSPGIRWAHDFRSGLQVVPGAAVALGVGPSRGRDAIFFYLSFEHPFRATAH